MKDYIMAAAYACFAMAILGVISTAWYYETNSGKYKLVSCDRNSCSVQYYFLSKESCEKTAKELSDSRNSFTCEVTE